MREIKFRAWIRDEYMSYSHTNKGLGYLEFNDDGSTVIGEDDGDQRYENIPLMQYTGLNDKNGKEIYEGDIIKVLDRDWSDMEKDTKYLIVYYSEDKFILINEQGIKEREKKEPDIYNKEWYETRLYKEYGRDRFEVIGNIYENPELLTNPLIEESAS